MDPFAPEIVVLSGRSLAAARTRGLASVARTIPPCPTPRLTNVVLFKSSPDAVGSPVGAVTLPTHDLCPLPWKDAAVSETLLRQTATLLACSACPRWGCVPVQIPRCEESDRRILDTALTTVTRTSDGGCPGSVFYTTFVRGQRDPQYTIATVRRQDGTNRYDVAAPVGDHLLQTAMLDAHNLPRMPELYKCADWDSIPVYAAVKKALGKYILCGSVNTAWLRAAIEQMLAFGYSLRT